MVSAAASSEALCLDPRKVATCIHCGLCLAACPTYLETGNENDSPRGRIYLMRGLQQQRLPLEGTAARHIDLCLGCRACEAVCPSGVPYGELVEATRDHVESHLARPFYQRLLRRCLIERVFPFPRRFRRLLALGRWIRRFGMAWFLPRFARDALNLLPPTGCETKLPVLTPSATPLACGRVGFLQGCVMPVLFGDTNKATITLLRRFGYEVATPADQTCCGALYAHNGNLDRARECARRNIAAFEAVNPEQIVVNAAGCGSMLKEYPRLLENDPNWSERARRFGAKIADLTEWLVQQPEWAARFSPLAEFGYVTYHDACHLAHAQRITQAPRQLLQALAGSRYVELPESDVCCGSAGTYNLTEPAMAARLQARKLERIEQTGAQLVVTTNPGCLLQIQSGLRRAGRRHVRAVHLADLLAASLAQSPDTPTPE